jgi:hypothetical protein
MINVDKEHEVDKPEVTEQPEVEQKPETEAKPETEIKTETENKPEVLKPEVQKPEVEVRPEGRMSIHEMEESLKRELTRDQCYKTFLRPESMNVCNKLECLFLASFPAQSNVCGLGQSLAKCSTFAVLQSRVSSGQNWKGLPGLISLFVSGKENVCNFNFGSQNVLKLFYQN